MISFLRGTVLAKDLTGIVLDVQGVGYSVFAPKQVLSAAELNHQIELHTAMIVREDAFQLFGFHSTEQRTLFDLLRSVTGVGPKTALAALSQLDAAEISNAVANEDSKAFEAVPGIGAKTAKLITVTLAGKLVSVQRRTENPSDSVLAALIGLGWQEKLASEAIKAALANGFDASNSAELLRSSLKTLSNRK